jgi:hypothetical protein
VDTFNSATTVLIKVSILRNVSLIFSLVEMEKYLEKKYGSPHIVMYFVTGTL